MSRYRDDLKAARLRTAALEEELDEHEAQLAAIIGIFSLMVRM